jgi:hypothetical protein
MLASYKRKAHIAAVVSGVLTIFPLVALRFMDKGPVEVSVFALWAIAWLGAYGYWVFTHLRGKGRSPFWVFAGWPLVLLVSDMHKSSEGSEGGWRGHGKSGW